MLLQGKSKSTKIAPTTLPFGVSRTGSLHELNRKQHVNE
jgi:hypothetical protein